MNLQLLVVTTIGMWTGLGASSLDNGSAWNRELKTSQVITLPAASLDEMYAGLAAARAVQIRRLHEYSAAGRFPRNKDFPGQLVPYFVDDTGTACAVGHLMRQDGHSQLVDSIAESSNHIRIADVVEGPLIGWILDSGSHNKSARRSNQATRQSRIIDEVESGRTRSSGCACISPKWRARF